MRFIRSDDNDMWHVINPPSGGEYCLERLAMSHHYRVADVCRALGCRPRYLHAVFSRDIGLPPKTWMNMERMVVARRKLEGGKTIEEVAQDLGFVSLEAFRRRFVKLHGIPPGRFLRCRRFFNQPALVDMEL